jgi:hypothetical protein
MAEVKKKRNAAATGWVISIEVLDTEIKGMTAVQVGHLAVRVLREQVIKRAAKDSADERIAAAQADKASTTEL